MRKAISAPANAASALAKTISAGANTASALAKTISAPANVASALAKTISAPANAAPALAKTISAPANVASALAKTISAGGATIPYSFDTMRSMRAILCLVAVLCVAGCHRGGYDQSLMARLTAPEQKIVGMYKLEQSFESGQSDELKKLAEAMEMMNGEVTMECLPDKSFTMTVSNIPIKGKWAMTGTAVTLTIDDVSGKAPGEIGSAKEKMRGVSGYDMPAAQRDGFMEDFMNSMALDRAKELVNLKVGVDGRSLYTTATGAGTVFGSSVSTFRPVPKS